MYLKKEEEDEGEEGGVEGEGEGQGCPHVHDGHEHGYQGRGPSFNTV